VDPYHQLVGFIRYLDLLDPWTNSQISDKLVELLTSNPFAGHYSDLASILTQVFKSKGVKYLLSDSVPNPHPLKAYPNQGTLSEADPMDIAQPSSDFLGKADEDQNPLHETDKLELVLKFKDPEQKLAARKMVLSWIDACCICMLRTYEPVFSNDTLSRSVNFGGVLEEIFPFLIHCSTPRETLLAFLQVIATKAGEAQLDAVRKVLLKHQCEIGVQYVRRKEVEYYLRSLRTNPSSKAIGYVLECASAFEDHEQIYSNLIELIARSDSPKCYSALQNVILNFKTLPNFPGAITLVELLRNYHLSLVKKYEESNNTWKMPEAKLHPANEKLEQFLKSNDVSLTLTGFKSIAEARSFRASGTGFSVGYTFSGCGAKSCVTITKTREYFDSFKKTIEQSKSVLAFLARLAGESHPIFDPQSSLHKRSSDSLVTPSPKKRCDVVDLTL
jgi:hypothetical protein